jgi:hypothetical protein
MVIKPLVHLIQPAIRDSNFVSMVNLKLGMAKVNWEAKIDIKIKCAINVARLAVHTTSCLTLVILSLEVDFKVDRFEVVIKILLANTVIVMLKGVVAIDTTIS